MYQECTDRRRQLQGNMTLIQASDWTPSPDWESKRVTVEEITYRDPNPKDIYD